MASSRSETSAEVVVVARGTLREELNEVERQKTGRLRIPTTSACDSEMTSAGASGLAAWRALAVKFPLVKILRGCSRGGRA
jgi:hypothetical protein